jgi:ATP-dependent protease HslVU (ClpYQ) peptidase subunit
VLGFVAVGDCSREADTLVVRILILRVMADLAGGRTHDIDALFQRLYASLQSHPDGHHLRRILLSMLSDRARCSFN